MKRVLLMLAATAAFACMTAYAQAGGGAGAGAGAGGGQAGAGNTSGGSASTGGTGSMASQNANGQSQMGAEMNGKKANKGSKDTITGCLSATPGSDGMYTLSSKDNQQIEVGPTEKVQASAGKKVKLSGSWSSAAAAGENASSANAGSAGVASSTSSEQNERHFDVKKVKDVSGSCSAQGAASSTPPSGL